MEQELDRKATIQYGLDIKEFLETPTGQYFLARLDLWRSLACIDGVLGKHRETAIDPQRPNYMVKEVAELERYRGKAEQCEIILQWFKGLIAKSERFLEEEKKEKAEKSE